MPRSNRKSIGRTATGFTLIELMIVVAIIGILAAIAIPNFLKMQLRAKAGEGKVNLAAIRTAQESYYAEVGFYVPWSSKPMSAGTPPGQAKVPWDSTLCSFPPSSSDPGFCAIGWNPEGPVYFNYAVETNTGVPITSSMFFAAAAADIDGESTECIFGVNKGDDAGGFMASGPLSCNDVLNQSNGTVVHQQVGPCDTVSMGVSIF